MMPPRRADSPVAFWSLMAFIFILFLTPQAIFPVLAPFRIALLAAAVAIIAYTTDAITAGRPIIVLTREARLVVCLLGWAILTIPFSYWPGGSVDTVTGVLLKSLVLFWLIPNVVGTVARLRQFAWGLTLVSVPIAAVALANYRSGVFLGSSERIVGYDSSLANDPNDLALTLNVILPFALGLVRMTRRPLVRAALLGIVALDIAAVVLTFSRGGFLALLVMLGITVLRLLSSAKRAWGIACLAALILCLPLVPPSYWDRLATVSDINSDPTGSAQARWARMVGALQFVLYHPVIGAGVGAGALALNEQVGFTWQEVHNTYLQWAVDLGLPGLILYLWLFVLCLGATSVMPHGAELLPGMRALRTLGDATRLSLITFGVGAFFLPVAYHFHFFYLAGLSVAARTAATRQANTLRGGRHSHA